jgi:hypothetical protein
VYRESKIRDEFGSGDDDKEADNTVDGTESAEVPKR